MRSLLRQRSPVDAADAEGMTALHWAAHHNDLTTVRALLAAGAKATVANRYGVTPLHEAATLGNAAMVTALLRAGADANAAYGDGETPLMIAARTGSVDAVKALLERGAKVNAAEQFRGQTALMLAVNENHAAVAKALVDAGADVNARTREYDFQKLTGGAGGIIHDRPQGGLNALILAARQGARESGDVLLAGGADINAVEPQYQFSALQTAIFNGQYAFAKMLIEKGANVNDGSLYMTMEMRNLAAYSNRPNPAESDAGVSHLDIATLLLDKGADPNAAYLKTIPPRQAQGNINVPPGGTPLYRAVRAVDLGRGQAARRARRHAWHGDQGRLDAGDGGRRSRRASRRRRGSDRSGRSQRPGGRAEGARRQGRGRERGERRRDDGAALRRAARLRPHHPVPRRSGREVRRQEQAGPDPGRLRPRPDGRTGGPAEWRAGAGGCAWPASGSARRPVAALEGSQLSVVSCR